MTRRSLLVLALLAAPVAHADRSRAVLPDELRPVIDAPASTTLTKLADVPLDLCEGIERVVGPVAREDEPYQVTDVVMDATLPERRFAWAEATGPSLVVVVLDHGGIGTHTDVIVLKRENAASMSLVWTADCPSD